MNKASIKAFTLVELAIVIVIIGLLVAGVLGGQQLISAAKRNSLIKEFQSYEAANTTFKGKYGFLPGDLPNATTILGYTCSNISGTRGDGRVEWTWVNYCGAEQTEYWRHLSLAKMIKGDYPGFCSGGCQIYIYNQFPLSKAYENTIFTMQYNTNYQNATPVYNNNGHFMLLHGRTAVNSVWNGFGPSLSQEDAYNIELKIDDGVPATGKLLTARMLIDPETSATATTGCLNASNQFTNTASSKPECMLFYKMD